MPGQAGLHADSKAYASLMRVARPWAAAPKMSAPQRLSTAGEAAPREPPRQGVTYRTEPGFTIPIHNTINKYKYVLYTILAQGPRIIPPWRHARSAQRLKVPGAVNPSRWQVALGDDV